MGLIHSHLFPDVVPRRCHQGVVNSRSITYCPPVTNPTGAQHEQLLSGSPPLLLKPAARSYLHASVGASGIKDATQSSFPW